MNYIDILTQLKKIVDEHEKTIDLTKIVYNEIKAFGRSSRVDLLCRRLMKIYARLALIGKYLQEYNKDKDSIDKASLEYIDTYTKYIILIGLPYEKDVLKEIKDMLSTNQDNKIVDTIDEIINKINEIIDSYKI